MSIGRISGLLFVSGLFMSCMEQYNPRPHWNKLKEERISAHREIPKLNEDGSLPAVKDPNGGQEQVELSEVDKAFNTYCVSCHGEDGKGETAAGKAMNPRPRNLTDVKWQDSVDDAHIEKVIRKGGASVGLSPTMAPWEALLPGDLPAQMVQKIRGLKGK